MRTEGERGRVAEGKGVYELYPKETVGAEGDWSEETTLCLLSSEYYDLSAPPLDVHSVGSGGRSVIFFVHFFVFMLFKSLRVRMNEIEHGTFWRGTRSLSLCLVSALCRQYE